MRNFTHAKCLSILTGLFLSVTASPLSVQAGSVGGFGGATELTQIANNAELIGIAGQNSQQIANQIRQIAQATEQIQNQLHIYQNMLDNTASLPQNIWGNAMADLNQLRSIVQQGQALSFSMGNSDDVLRQRFGTLESYRNSPLNQEQLSQKFADWSATSQDTVAGSLRAANLTSEQFASEDSTLRQLQAQSDNAIGQKQALQAGNQIAGQTVEQLQKLRGLTAQHMTLMAGWIASEQARRDLAQAEREKFFTPPTTWNSRDGKPFDGSW